MGISNVIELLSGVALFLFGMSLMGDGLKKVAGNKLELVLYKLSGSPIKGVLLGTGVTAIIQSSSATSVMVVGFVNSGMMQVKQAIGIVMGAILGTSVTGWIICLSALEGGSGWVALLSTSTLTGVVAVIGILLRMISKKQSRVHMGDILMGFAVLMFGMQAMSGAVSPLRESEAFLDLLTTFSNPILGILVGLVFTSVLQSASAAVGILQALAATGVITFSVAFPLIMGIAVGAAMPVLLSSLGANINGKRTAFVYLLIDVLGAVIWSVLFYAANAVVHFSFMDTSLNAVGIAFLNTLFRLATVVVLTPFIGIIEKQICRLFQDTEPAGPEKEDFARLEARFIGHPSVAIEQCREALCNMALEAKANLEDAYYLIGDYNEKRFQFVTQREDVIDKYEDKLGSYLIQLTGKELTDQQNKDVTKFLHAIGDVERIGDHAMNIAECAKEINEKHIVFSAAAQQELTTMFDAVQEITYNAITAFTTGDLELAYRIEPLEELIDSLCDEMKLHHVDRLQRGICKLDQGFVFNDLLTNYERVADHCSNIAVAMIELESASFDTHEYIISLKNARAHNFDQYYEEYRQKFALPEE
ncbi:MAG: Na/Pi cotransporter family protein [Clostridiales bacterium]|nr:Na/Pi cotransporter family protein [Clostridiales bacterium]MDY4173592.1 Na/Pi cotransporter family protein [Evtepia sp.]